MAKPPKRGLHPLRIGEAMEAINSAAALLTATATTVADLIERVGADAATRKLLADQLRDATAHFRAVIWPEGDE